VALDPLKTTSPQRWSRKSQVKLWSDHPKGHCASRGMV
jgi:hypothetical protein